MKRAVDAYVVCPYYKSEERQVIYCEGVEENASTHMAFSTPQKKKDYLTYKCRKNWKSCLWADALNRKWEGCDRGE